MGLRKAYRNARDDVNSAISALSAELQQVAQSSESRGLIEAQAQFLQATLQHADAIVSGHVVQSAPRMFANAASPHTQSVAQEVVNRARALAQKGDKGQSPQKQQLAKRGVADDGLPKYNPTQRDSSYKYH